jgi:ATP-binding cassette subfamily B (MDR/TAP) protein 1
LIAIAASFAWPLYGIFYCELLFVMMQSHLPNFVADRNFWCSMFLIHNCVLGVIYFIMKYIFFYAGENLTYELRLQLFKGIVYKHIGWFDSKEYAPGILSNILSEDIANINGLTTEHLAILLEAYGGLVIGTIFAMFYSWKMGLITIGLVPFVSLGGILMSRLAWKVKPSKANNIEGNGE